MHSVKGKKILITGATGGLGQALCQVLAPFGPHLILLGRSIEKLESLDDQLSDHPCNTTLVPIDLNDLEKLSSIGPLLNDRLGTVDAFVGAAATLGQLGPLTHQPSSDWHEVWTVNFHAHWYLLKSLEPLLRQAQDPRVVFITSGLVRSHIPYWGAYALSKAALEAMAFSYAAETKNLNFKVNLLDPGIMQTELFKKAMPGVDLATVPTPQKAALKLAELLTPTHQTTGELFKA